MEIKKLQRGIGFLISAGAFLLLIVQLLLVFRQEAILSEKILYYLFGSLLNITSSLIALLWIPWAGIILAVVLWFGIRLTRGKTSTRFSIAIAIIGAVMAVAWIFGKSVYTYFYYWGGNAFINLASWLTIIGIALFVITNYKQIFATLLPETGSVAVAVAGETTDTEEITQTKIVREEKNNQVITGIDIPFMDLVVFFIKASFAAIPAGIIWLSLIYSLFSSLIQRLYQSRPF